MVTTSFDPNATTAVVTDVEVTGRRPYLDWAAVVAGAVIATAMSLLLTMFGSSVGLFVASPWSENGISAESIGIIAAIWFAFTYIYSIGMGAYFTGRMRARMSGFKSDETGFRDGANGLVVWALSLIIGACLAAIIGSSVANLATKTALSAARSTAEIVAPVADDAGDALWREFAPESPANQTQQPPAGQPATTTQTGPSRAQREEVVRILREGLINGEIKEEDRTYLARLIQSKTGLTLEQAEQRVRSTVTGAIDRAKSVVEAARKGAAFAGFWASLVLLLSGVAAWWAASLGGSHRDEQTLAT
ncbi:hypothetical protein [Filomicrobium sp.]|uniref:hypothetical protein n=1 Tax=Filomicrobium sp. TaxID=2024831 RepID=UPI0025828F84|nr:hypothetical protein [Filomicrobium sp.]MCV0370456.1 hypothetical protein [Filomicrobium sp.]